MRRRAVLAFTILASAGLAAGCRIKSPTLEEQRALAERGAFGSGTPAWMSAAAGVRSGSGGGIGGGLIPQVFSPPGDSIAGNTQQQAALRKSAEEALDEQREAQQKLRTADDRTTKATDTYGSRSGATEKESPLDRILAACPGIESQVNDALTTVDTDQRIAKYVQLTNRCSHSWDLWLWLGKDYQKKNRLVQASRCYEKALILNNQAEEAEQLLAESRKKLGSGGGKESAKGQVPAE